MRGSAVADFVGLLDLHEVLFHLAVKLHVFTEPLALGRVGRRLRETLVFLRHYPHRNRLLHHRTDPLWRAYALVQPDLGNGWADPRATAARHFLHTFLGAAIKSPSAESVRVKRPRLDRSLKPMRLDLRYSSPGDNAALSGHFREIQLVAGERRNRPARHPLSPLQWAGSAAEPRPAVLQSSRQR